MSQFSIGGLTSAGSSTLPIFSLYAGATARGVIREIGVFNTTAVAVSLKLSRLDTAGTKPAALTDGEWDQEGPPALCTAHLTHTVGPTIDEELKRVSLGAAIGSGIIWTFGGRGLIVPLGVANGIGLVPIGTGQVCDAYVEWEE